MNTINNRLVDIIGDVFLTSAAVTAVEHVSPGFVRVDLQSDEFRSRKYLPGTKVQLRLQQGALQMRTYTPVRWDAERGVTELIAYTHGNGLASSWFSKAQPGQTCDVFGPRHSLDLSGLQRPLVFVGDESSVALGCALRTTEAAVHYVFEATDPDALTAMLDAVHFTQTCTVVAKSADRAELLQQTQAAAQVCDSPFDLVVTGDAKTVHSIRRGIRSWPDQPRDIKGKAYWAEGRTGLD